jgi:hypothetical protein
LAIQLLDQETQVRRTFPVASYGDAVAPTEAAFETNPVSLMDDLNNVRSQLHNLLKNQAGNWFDDLNTPSTLESGSQRGVNDLNTALHAVEKKRVLRDVWKILDICPGLDLAITLVNELKADYEAHRVLTAGSVHGAADTTNTVSAADATDEATAITLANEIKVDYEAHRVLTAGSVHGAADATNDVTAADATDLATLITLVDDLRVQYEAHRVLIAGSVHGAADSTNVVSAPAVGSTFDVHILSAAQLPTQTTAAVGAVTTLGTVVADAASFGTAGLDEVAGSSDVSPKNLCPIVDGDTHLDPILVGGKQVYALFQTESDTDGHTMTGSASTRAQLSFVTRNTTGDDLELVDIPSDTCINYAARERVRLEDLTEQDFLKGAIVEFPAATTVTRQEAYNNQGTTPVDVVTNSTLDLEGPGLTWTIRDDLEAMLLQVVEGSSGGTSQVNIGTDVDEFDVDAAVNDFLNGISVDSGAAGTKINLGVTANKIDTTGALTVEAGGDLKLDSTGGNLRMTDQYEPAGWSEDGIQLSDAAQTWTDFEAAFGEVGLMDAIVAAYNKTGRRKVYSICTVAAAADADVSGPTDDANLDTDLGDISAGTFVSDYDIYLNGALQVNGADAAANKDVYPGTALANGQLKFEKKIKVGDVIILIDWIG